ncbi:MAG: hypothetical protein U0R50_10725 [Gaiellales bacterium]
MSESIPALANLREELVAAVALDVERSRGRRATRRIAAVVAVTVLAATGVATAATGGSVNFFRSDGRPVDPSSVKVVNVEQVGTTADGRRVLRITDVESGKVQERVVSLTGDWRTGDPLKESGK